MKDNRIITRILCLVMAVVMVMSMAGCGTKTEAPAQTAAPVEETAAPVEETAAPAEEAAAPAEEAAAPAEETAESVEEPAAAAELTYTELGEGKLSFTFVVTAGEEVTGFIIHTDAATVGEALLALELIAGENSEYGLYVKTVNGVTADYNVDGHYWAFYINGEYAQTGVDSTEITDGAVYAFTIE